MLGKRASSCRQQQVAREGNAGSAVWPIQLAQHTMPATPWSAPLTRRCGTRRGARCPRAWATWWTRWRRLGSTARVSAFASRAVVEWTCSALPVGLTLTSICSSLHCLCLTCPPLPTYLPTRVSAPRRAALHAGHGHQRRPGPEPVSGPRQLLPQLHQQAVERREVRAVQPRKGEGALGGAHAVLTCGNG